MARTVSPRPRVGIIGLGAMGSRFAGRLLDSGYRVTAYNRTRGRAIELDGKGLIRVDSPREVSMNSDVVLIMLWDSAAVCGAARGDNGLIAGLAQDAVVIDLSTIEPNISAALATEVALKGGAMLDCPVSGSLDAAEQGSVLVMAGGSAAALDVVKPVLAVLASRIEHVGEKNGSGLALKLAVNLQVAIQAVGWGEAMSLTDEFGIDRRRAAEIMLNSVVASPMLKYRVPFSLDEPEEIWATVAQLRKDISYARASRTRSKSRAGDLALELMDSIIASGRGGKEAAELILEASGSGCIPVEGEEL